MAHADRHHCVCQRDVLAALEDLINDAQLNPTERIHQFEFIYLWNGHGGHERAPVSMSWRKFRTVLAVRTG
jgi:hypothetical protein